MVEKKAALMIAEKNLEEEFKNVLEDLIQNEEKQLKLGKKIYSLAKPNATKTIVEEIEKWLPQELIK
jgi:UDP-N-acetylglucosamine--N-acetylmuramyl-(pentapeptide) pyrophosphoryl-undecaprenol N-acetylglucosamine transferase